MKTEVLLAARGKTHGNFTTQSYVVQQLKEVIADGLRSQGKHLQSEPQEALDMICHKIGRIVVGSWDFKDHWDDIAGYAKLVSDRCPQAVHEPRALAQADRIVRGSCPDTDDLWCDPPRGDDEGQENVRSRSGS